MTHMRYWGMSLGVAISGALIAITRFAFAQTHAIWIVFGLAIAAAVLSLAAAAVALLRENHAFSGISALSALSPALSSSPRGRSRHRARSGSRSRAGSRCCCCRYVRLRCMRPPSNGSSTRSSSTLRATGRSRSDARPVTRWPRVRPGRPVELSTVMRSWTRWLAYVAVALAGAFVVLATFAWQSPTSDVSLRWLAFGVGIAAATTALIPLVDHVVAISTDGVTPVRQLSVLLATAITAIAAALIVLMVVMHGSDARWWAFGLGAGLAGSSLLALTVHELSSERIRHELEIAHPTAAATAETVGAAN